MRYGMQDIINETQKYLFKSILDIGLGHGEMSKYFIKKGKRVTATGLAIDTYNLTKEVKENINLIENANVESMHTISSEKFDAVWISNVLEHTRNPGKALDECWRVLKPKGWLFITVPPYNPKLKGGHITNGWTIGQLLYNLVLAGFNVKESSCIKHKNNIACFCQKTLNQLPPLRYDNGDIETLKKQLPSWMQHTHNGDIESYNWKWKYWKPTQKEKLLKIIKKI